MSSKVIRNIPTKDLLLLLAQANSLGYPFVDLFFDVQNKVIKIQPISINEGRKRFTDGRGETNMEDLINES